MQHPNHDSALASSAERVKQARINMGEARGRLAEIYDRLHQAHVELSSAENVLSHELTCEHQLKTYLKFYPLTEFADAEQLKDAAPSVEDSKQLLVSCPDKDYVDRYIMSRLGVNWSITV